MKQHFLFLTLLVSTSLFPSTKQTEDVNIKQAVLTSLLAFSVYEQATENNNTSSEEEPKYTPKKQFTYKPQPKRDKSQRKQQGNSRIQQYRRR